MKNGYSIFVNIQNTPFSVNWTIRISYLNLKSLAPKIHCSPSNNNMRERFWSHKIDHLELKTIIPRGN